LKSRLSNGALQSEQDGFDPRAERVVLMTLHASKGLEFPMVFIVGCEDGYLPMRRGDEDPSKEQIEEEKRLLYVGMTRAERQLTLLHAKRRLRFGQRVERAPSPFLCEVEDVLLHREHSRYEKKKEEPEPQLTLF